MMDTCRRLMDRRAASQLFQHPYIQINGRQSHALVVFTVLYESRAGSTPYFLVL